MVVWNFETKKCPGRGPKSSTGAFVLVLEYCLHNHEVDDTKRERQHGDEFKYTHRFDAKAHRSRITPQMTRTGNSISLPLNWDADSLVIDYNDDSHVSSFLGVFDIISHQFGRFFDDQSGVVRMVEFKLFAVSF